MAAGRVNTIELDPKDSRRIVVAIEVDENLRWKYRYVDLRRERSRELIRLRHEVVDFIRNFMVERGFWEVETTDLIRSDPADGDVEMHRCPGPLANPRIHATQSLKQQLVELGLGEARH